MVDLVDLDAILGKSTASAQCRTKSPEPARTVMKRTDSGGDVLGASWKMGEGGVGVGGYGRRRHGRAGSRVKKPSEPGVVHRSIFWTGPYLMMGQNGLTKLGVAEANRVP